MPLVIVAGHPCVGKSTFSLKLREYLESNCCSVHIVNEESEKISRLDGYADSGREKTTRGVLKSAIDHSLNDQTYVIADSLNYIKGYRYELYCMARTQKTQHCCVLVRCDEGLSQKWHDGKKESDGEVYDSTVMADLKRRFEMPNERNRWDAPLFRVDMTPKDFVIDSKTPHSKEGEQQGTTEVKTSSFRRKPKGRSGASVAVNTIARSVSADKKTAIGGPLVFNRLDAAAREEGGVTVKENDENPSVDSVIESIFTYLSTSEAPTPNVSTVKKVSGGANMSDELEIVAAEICSSIAQHQIATDAEESIPILFPQYDRKIDLPPRRLGQSELLSLRNQWVKMNRQRPPSSSTEAGSTFIDFVANQT